VALRHSAILYTYYILTEGMNVILQWWETFRKHGCH